MASSSKIIDKIEKFFWKLEELMEKHGFEDAGGEDYKYCNDNDRVWWLEGIFEKDDKYVDISLILLLDDNCEPIKVKDIDIDDDDDILSDELYQKIIELYKKFFQDNEQ